MALCLKVTGTPEDCADDKAAVADEVTCLLLVGVNVILPVGDFNVPFDKVVVNVVEFVFEVAVKEAIDLTTLLKLTLPLAMVFSFCTFDPELFDSLASNDSTFESLPFILLPSTDLVLEEFI